MMGRTAVCVLTNNHNRAILVAQRGREGGKGEEEGEEEGEEGEQQFAY